MGTAEWAGRTWFVPTAPALGALFNLLPASSSAGSTCPNSGAPSKSKGRREAGEMQEVQQPCTSCVAVKWV